MKKNSLAFKFLHVQKLEFSFQYFSIGVLKDPLKSFKEKSYRQSSLGTKQEATASLQTRTDIGKAAVLSDIDFSTLKDEQTIADCHPSGMAHHRAVKMSEWSECGRKLVQSHSKFILKRLLLSV